MTTSEIAVGQGPLQFGDARVGDLGAGEEVSARAAWVFEIRQSRGGDLGAVWTVVTSLPLMPMFAMELLELFNGQKLLDFG